MTFIERAKRDPEFPQDDVSFPQNNVLPHSSFLIFNFLSASSAFIRGSFLSPKSPVSLLHHAFYNGKDELPDDYELKLSEAFFTESENPSLELKVKVFNIGNLHLPLVRKCDKIMEYTKFINFVYKNADLHNPDSCKNVLQQASKKGFMPNYLERKILEVENMLCAKYDYDLDIQVKKEEAFEEGKNLGIAQGVTQNSIETAKRMLAKNLDIELIKQITTLSEEEIANINR